MILNRGYFIPIGAICQCLKVFLVVISENAGGGTGIYWG